MFACVLAPDFEARAQGDDLAAADDQDEGAALMLGDVEQRFASFKADLADAVGVVDADAGVGVQRDFGAVAELDGSLFGVAGGEDRVLQQIESRSEYESEQRSAGDPKAGCA